MRPYRSRQSLWVVGNTDKRNQSLLLKAVITAIYASKNSIEAYNFLIQALKLAFRINPNKANIYVLNVRGSKLEIINDTENQSFSTKSVHINDESQDEVKFFLSKNSYEIVNEDLFVPILRKDGSKNGLIVIRGPRLFSNGDNFWTLLSFLKAAGGAIGNVIDREEQTVRLKHLQQISADIVSDLTLDTILLKIAKSIIYLIGADRSLFILFDHQKNKSPLRVDRNSYTHQDDLKMRDIKGVDVIVRGQGYSESHYTRLESSFEEIAHGLTGWVYDNKKEYAITKNGSKDPRNQGAALVTARQLQTGPLMVVSLHGRKGFMGTLTAIRENRKDIPIAYFTQEDLDLIRMLANHAAIAIENNNLILETTVDATKTFHTIKGKANAICVAARTLKKVLPKDSENDRIIKNIESCASALENFTTKLVSISTSSHKKLDLKHFDIDEFIGELVAEKNWQAIKPHIENPNPALLAYADKGRLKEALNEILNNSIKILREKGQGKIWIRVIHLSKELVTKYPTRFSKGGITIQIEDNGPGIKNSDKPKIWQFGYTLTPGGTGIGLYSAKMTIEAHRGLCYEDGMYLKGARFNILLPFRTEEI